MHNIQIYSCKIYIYIKRSVKKNTEISQNKSKRSGINKKQKAGINKDKIRKSTEKI